MTEQETGLKYRLNKQGNEVQTREVLIGLKATFSL